jgi:hypothetical protein
LHGSATKSGFGLITGDKKAMKGMRSHMVTTPKELKTCKFASTSDPRQSIVNDTP